MNYSFYCIGPDDVLRLRDEHSFLERQLAEVITLAAANRPKDCGLALYPWLGALAPHRLSWAVMRLIIAPSASPAELR